MGIRDRKDLLITSIKFRCKVAKITQDQIEGWVLLMRRARTPSEQDQVMAALDHHINGWKTARDEWSVLRRMLNDD